VFVDEECAVRNECEEDEQRSHLNRQRQVRDERTFREREGEEVVSQSQPERYAYFMI
jgi:hypothetical protein